VGTILIYFILFAFWLEHSIHFELEKVFGLSMGLSLKNLSLYVLFMAWPFAIKRKGTLFQRNNLNKYLVLIIFIIMLSIPLKFLLNEIPGRPGLDEIVGFKDFVDPWLFFFLISHIIEDKRTCERAILGLIVLLAVTVLTMLVQWYTGFDLGTQAHIAAYEGRSTGFAEANQYAGFLVLLLPLFLTSVMLEEDMKKKVKSAFFMLFGLAGLITTGSRGGFGAFFFGLTFLFIVAFRQRMISGTRILLIALSIFVLLPCSLLVAPSEVREKTIQRIINPANPKEVTNPWTAKWLAEQTWLETYSSGRISIWARSLKIFFESPVFGHGHDADMKVYNQSTHNDYLKYLVNYGIVGFLIYILMLIGIFRHVFYHLKTASTRASRFFYLSYLSGFAGYAAAMFSVNMFFAPRFIFWLYTAVVYSYIRFEKNEQN